MRKNKKIFEKRCIVFECAIVHCYCALSLFLSVQLCIAIVHCHCFWVCNCALLLCIVIVFECAIVHCYCALSLFLSVQLCIVIVHCHCFWMCKLENRKQRNKKTQHLVNTWWMLGNYLSNTSRFNFWAIVI